MACPCLNNQEHAKTYKNNLDTERAFVTTNDSSTNFSTRSCALFVSGSPAGISPETLQDLAVHARFILAVDSGAHQVHAAGITPHLILGDMDSIDPSVLAHYKAEGVEVRCFDAYKDATDVELALEELIQRGYTHIIATNVLGGRSDHALGSLAALAKAAQEGAAVMIHDQNELCFFLSAHKEEQVLELDFSRSSIPRCTLNGQPNQWFNVSSQPSQSVDTYFQPSQSLDTDFQSSQRFAEEHVSPASTALPQHVSLVSWGGTTVVSEEGLEWPLDHYKLESTSARGISNVARCSIMRISVHEGEGVALLLVTLSA